MGRSEKSRFRTVGKLMFRRQKVLRYAIPRHTFGIRRRVVGDLSCTARLHSQGATRDEAIDNIKVAIREWLEVEAEESGVIRIEEAVVTI